eukprot:1330128-Amorphochlora_amoeboformis.AAC.2
MDAKGVSFVKVRYEGKRKSLAMIPGLDSKRTAALLKVSKVVDFGVLFLAGEGAVNHPRPEKKIWGAYLSRYEGCVSVGRGSGCFARSEYKA